jgi:Flp pilus assembly protein TadG
MSPFGSRRRSRSCGSAPRPLRALLADRRGATAVEFAVVGSIFIMLVLGVVELGRYFITLQSARSFTQEVARSALVLANRQLANGNTDNCSATLTSTNITPPASGGTLPTITSIYAKTPFLQSGCAQPTISLACSPDRRITVTTSCPFTFVVPFLPSGLQDLSTTVLMDIP